MPWSGTTCTRTGSRGSYFWRRCFSVNRGKVLAFRQMGEARNLQAERRFARRSLTQGLARGGRELVKGDAGGASRSAVICIGLLLAGLGYAVGSIEWSLTTGRQRGTDHRAPAVPADGSGRNRPASS